MHTTRFYSVLLTVALVCAGCAGPNTVKDDFSFAQNPGKGLLAFSTRWVSDCSTGLIGGYSAVDYRDGDKSVQVILHNPFVSDDFKNPPGRMIFNVASAGTHEIYDLRFHVGGVDYSMDFKKPIEIHVRAGKVNYAGELTVKITSCGGEEKINGISFNTARASLHVSNQWNRDRAILMKQHPEIMKNQAVVALMHQ